MTDSTTIKPPRSDKPPRPRRGPRRGSGSGPGEGMETAEAAVGALAAEVVVARVETAEPAPVAAAAATPDSDQQGPQGAPEGQSSNRRKRQGRGRGPRPERRDQPAADAGQMPRPNRGGQQPGGQGRPGGRPEGAPREFEGGREQGPSSRRAGGRPGKPGFQGGQKPRQGGQGGQGGGQPAQGRPYSDAKSNPGNWHSPAKGAADQGGVRLSKLIVDRGLCSVREAEEYLNKGWVIVNGERVFGASQRAHPACELRLAPEARGEQPRGVTLLLHKPVDVASGAAEAGFGTALELVTSESLDDRYDGPIFHASHLEGLAPVGQLDTDATGLLILTQDERVRSELEGESAQLETEYLVGITGAPDDDLLQRLERELSADDQALPPASVTRQGDDQLRLVVPARRAGDVAQACERVGLQLTSLKRVRIGRVRLGDLTHGKWRYLRDDESF